MVGRISQERAEKGRACTGLLEERVVEGEGGPGRGKETQEGKATWNVGPRESIPEQGLGHWPTTRGTRVVQPQADPSQWPRTIFSGWSRHASPNLGPDRPRNSAQVATGLGEVQVQQVLFTVWEPRENLSQV